MSNNKPKTSNKGDINKVSAMDVCQTPPHALEPLYPYLPKDITIWESACGPEEILANTLCSRGYTVHATDLMHGDIFNRFTYKHGLTKWIEVTNMPFSIKYKWLEKSFSDGMPFALLAPYETTAAAAFKKLVEKYNGKPWHIEKLTPERRINYKMPNKGWDSSAQMPTCWITWGLNIHHTKNIDDTLFEYYVPMRNVRYGNDNKEM
jgi:hypothetical protein